MMRSTPLGSDAARHHLQEVGESRSPAAGDNVHLVWIRHRGNDSVYETRMDANGGTE
jgi:hypothetical protein